MLQRTCVAVGILVVICHAAVMSKSSRTIELPRKDDHELKITVDEEFVKTYLRTFGYLNATLEDPTNDDMSEAVSSFQTFMGIPATGIMNGATATLMARKRCGNKDVHPVLDTPLWKQNNLTWNITHFPTWVAEDKLRELIQQAFSAWEVVINVSFKELDSASNADIVLSFEHAESDWQNDATHLTIGRASGPIASRVWLSADEVWTTDPEDDGILLFNVLVHELGHVLGMRHSSDANSVMHPLFDRAMGKLHPEITIDDVERIRSFYEFQLPENATDIDDVTNSTSKGCPTTYQSIVNMPSGQIFVFENDHIWLVENSTISTPSKEVMEVFDSGPSYVNASATLGLLTILVSDREIHGYLSDLETGKLTSAPGFPKVLHNRVLFYADAAFPLANGSLVLLRDDIFATYDVYENVPTMLNDKRVYFPNLPDGVIGAIPEAPGSDDMFFFFTNDTVYLYDMRIQQVLETKKINDTIACDL